MTRPNGEVAGPEAIGRGRFTEGREPRLPTQLHKVRADEAGRAAGDFSQVTDRSV